MQKNRILIFSLVYLPRFVGGAEIAVKEITDRTPEAHFDMVVLCTKRTRIEQIGNVTVHHVGPYVGGTGALQRILRAVLKHYYPIRAYFYAKRMHQRENYSLVWSIMASYSGFAALFFKLRFPKVPFLLTLQEGDPISHIKLRALPVYPLFVLIFKKADSIQTISNYLATFAKYMGFRGETIVIPNGVDIEHFSKPIPEEERKVLRAKCGYTNDDMVIVTASRLVKKNGVEDILYALSLLPKQYVLLIAGAGKLEGRLKSKVKGLKLEKRVRFLGFIPQSELPAYLHASDIFIRPSLSEGLGNAFLEAMARGLPVIATPVGGIGDFLRDKETGLYCQVHDPKSIAAAVLALANPELRNTLIQNGRKLVVEKYDWDKIVPKMKSLFFTSNMIR